MTQVAVKSSGAVSVTTLNSGAVLVERPGKPAIEIDAPLLEAIVAEAWPLLSDRLIGQVRIRSLMRQEDARIAALPEAAS